MHYSALQSLAAYLEHVTTINGGGCLDCTDESSSCGILSDDILDKPYSYDITNWETHLYSKP